MSSLTNHRPWWHISHRLPRNPFNPAYPIPHLEYCVTCKMDVDVDVEAANADGVDVYRKRCKRCGKPVQWGIGRRDLFSKKPLPQKAIRFVQETGRDRR